MIAEGWAEIVADGEAGLGVGSPTVGLTRFFHLSGVHLSSCLKSQCWTRTMRFLAFQHRILSTNAVFIENKYRKAGLESLTLSLPASTVALQGVRHWGLYMQPLTCGHASPHFSCCTRGLSSNYSMCRCLCLLERVSGSPGDLLAEPLSWQQHLRSLRVLGDSGNLASSAWSSPSAPRNIA